MPSNSISSILGLLILLKAEEPKTRGKAPMWYCSELEDFRATGPLEGLPSLLTPFLKCLQA